MQGGFRADQVGCVGIVGAGLIGASWAAGFHAAGLSVRVCDPDPAALVQCATLVERALDDLARLDKVPPSTTPAIQYGPGLDQMLAGADYVQENAPERLDLKQELMARLDEILPSDVLIGSSTSSLRASDMQLHCQSPERILVAHPFNPPHLVPLVELVGGRQTAEQALDAAYCLFKRIGKVPVKVRGEETGHLANRMSSALWREAVHIVASGIASVEDVDRAIRFGPGLRWAVEGPHMLYHLGGGERGIRGYLDHLGDTQEARWAELGSPRLDETTRAMLVEGIAEEAGGKGVHELSRARDERLIAVLRALDA
jgi:carnitine 3-dehydrogenase